MESTTTTLLPQTRLSDILPPNEAVRILGLDTARIIIRDFLRSDCCSSAASSGVGGHRGGASSSSSSVGTSTKAIRYRHPLDPKESNDEKAEIDLLLLGLSHDFTQNSHDDDDDNSNSNNRREVGKAWSKLGFHSISGYEFDLIGEMKRRRFGNGGRGGGGEAVYGGGISSHSISTEESGSGVGGKSPLGIGSGGGSSRGGMDTDGPNNNNTANNNTPYTVELLFTQAIHRTHSVLGLDKSSYLKRGTLFPPTAVPDRGPNGHMALMDCVFNALSCTPPDPQILMDEAMEAAKELDVKRSSHDERMAAVLAAGRGRSRILLPDLVISFAICRLVEWELEYRGYREERRVESEERHREVQLQLMELENCIGEEEGGGDGGSSGENGGATVESVAASPKKQTIEPTPPPRSDGLLLASLLSFRIYDGYQRQNSLTRDTLQRFLSDIHGEESYKAPAVRACLDRLFTVSERPRKELGMTGGGSGGAHQSRILDAIDPDRFQKGIHSTITFSPTSVSIRALHDVSSKQNGGVNMPEASIVASHVLLDWIIILFNCMLPRQLPPPSKVAEYHLRIVNSDPIRMINALSTKYGLYDGNGEGDTVLYEIRRRFHSLQKNNLSSVPTTVQEEKAEVLSEKDGAVDTMNGDNDSQLPLGGKEGSGSSAVGAANICADTGALLASEERTDDTTSRPRNVIDEHSFVKEVSQSNDELGHGGYLPAELAKLTFRAGAGRAEEVQNVRGSDLWNKDEEKVVRDQHQLLSGKPSYGNRYWTMYDTLSFCCEAVRWEAMRNSSEGDAGDNTPVDNKKYGSEMPLLRLAFKTFQQLQQHESVGETTTETNAEKVLTRSQIGRMLILLLEHELYRLEADSPPSTTGDTSESRIHWTKTKDEGVELTDDESFLQNLSESSGSGGFIDNTLVDASYASLLGLLPPKLDLAQFSTPSTPSQSNLKQTSARSVPLGVLVDYVISEANSSETREETRVVLDFEGFVRWHLRLSSSETDGAMSVAETRLGPYLLDLRLIASVLFGVRPASSSTEKHIIDEIKRRHKYRYPRTRDGSSQPRGPSGTAWYVINAEWWRTWKHYTEGKAGDGDAARSYVLSKIDNNMLLSEQGILSLKQGLHWKRDFEVRLLFV